MTHDVATLLEEFKDRLFLCLRLPRELIYLHAIEEHESIFIGALCKAMIAIELNCFLVLLFEELHCLWDFEMSSLS